MKLKAVGDTFPSSRTCGDIAKSIRERRAQKLDPKIINQMINPPRLGMYENSFDDLLISLVSGQLDASRKDGQKSDDASVLFVITFAISLLRVDIHYAGNRFGF